MKFSSIVVAFFLILNQAVIASDTFNPEKLKFIYKTNKSFVIKPYVSYDLQKNNDLDCRPFSIDYKNKKLTIDGENGKTHYTIVTHINRDNFVGEWFEKSSKNNVDTTAKIKRNNTDYDYDYVEVNHSEKTYSTTHKDNLNSRYFILDDFIVIDYFDDGYYFLYFATSMTKDKIEYVNCYGETFSEMRSSGQNHLTIPEGYKKNE